MTNSRIVVTRPWPGCRRQTDAGRPCDIAVCVIHVWPLRNDQVRASGLAHSGPVRRGTPPARVTWRGADATSCGHDELAGNWLAVPCVRHVDGRIVSPFEMRDGRSCVLPQRYRAGRADRFRATRGTTLAMARSRASSPLSRSGRPRRRRRCADAGHDHVRRPRPRGCRPLCAQSQ